MLTLLLLAAGTPGTTVTPTGLSSSAGLGGVAVSTTVVAGGVSGTAGLGTPVVNVGGTTVVAAGSEAAAVLGTVALSAIAQPAGIAGTSAVGTTTVRAGSTVAVAGLAATADMGVPALGALHKPAGVSAATGLGTVALSSLEAPTGLSGTTSLGTVTLTVSIVPSGVAATAAVGTPVFPAVLIQPAGQSMTSATGTARVRSTVVGSTAPTTERWVSPRLPAGDQLLGVLQQSLDRLERVQGRSPVIATDRRVTSAVTVVDSDGVVLVDCAAGAVAVNLPPASAAIRGRSWAIKKMDSTGNNVTLTAAGSDTIDGAATYAFNTQYKVVWVQCALVTPPGTYGWVLI